MTDFNKNGSRLRAGAVFVKTSVTVFSGNFHQTVMFRKYPAVILMSVKRSMVSPSAVRIKSRAAGRRTDYKSMTFAFSYNFSLLFPFEPPVTGRLLFCGTAARKSGASRLLRMGREIIRDRPARVFHHFFVIFLLFRLRGKNRLPDRPEPNGPLRRRNLFERRFLPAAHGAAGRPVDHVTDRGKRERLLRRQSDHPPKCLLENRFVLFAVLPSPCHKRIEGRILPAGIPCGGLMVLSGAKLFSKISGQITYNFLFYICSIYAAVI